MTQSTITAERRVDPTWLRDVLGCFATGVTVVTANGPSGEVGITANSFTSVSLDPPLVLFCVANSSRSLKPIKRAKGFAVNILGKGQERLSKTFAAKVDDRFAEVSTRTDTTGAPVLSDALAFLDCELVESFERGDHLIVLGEVVSGGVLKDTAEPLLFFRGAYR
jgi:3-hydroxy-9,10-secoandrosta-1,3,5(10)-triene-9,17-dione monooxygenase reductase component